MYKNLGVTEESTAGIYLHNPSLGYDDELILAHGDVTSSYSTHQNDYFERNKDANGHLAVRFDPFPAELAVDANRDGTLKFAGNHHDPEVSDKPMDATTQEKPYRFWINTDSDTDDNGDTVPASTPDCADQRMIGRRDLEDFTRLHIFMGGFQEAIGNGDMLVGLKWKNTGETSPSINIFEAVEADGGTQYLSSDTVAAQQASTGSAVRSSIPNKEGQYVRVNGASTFILDGSFWSGLSSANPNKYLLFEGCTEGKGQLVLTFHKPDGTQIREAPGVWMDLVNVRKMYRRVKAAGIGDSFQEPSDTTIGVPPEPTMGWDEDPNGNPYDDSAASWEETRQYIVFVHGWNMSYDDSQSYGETMFKRLWQRGYKGRYAFMRWPTLDDSVPTPIGEVPYTYNASEYRAWKCGESLKQFVNSLPGDHTRNLVAHSMGNVVVGSALQKGMALENYALLNAAVSAGCYDDSATLDQGWGYSTPFYDSDAGIRNLSHRNQLAVVNGNLINFFLPADDALAKWEWNNDTPGTAGRFLVGLKPQRYNLGTTGYYYDPSQSVGDRLGINYFLVIGRSVTTAHESMSYVAASPMKAVGAEGSTAGAIDRSVDMRTYDFDKIHSAEFRACY